jgi:AcrR family transcriptional regulator
MSRVTRARAASAPLPSGRHGLSVEYVAANQRARLLRAVGEVCAERGWARATVADIVRAACVSPRTFYHHFPSKEQCFQAAFVEAVREAETTVLAEVGQGEADGEDWPAMVAASLRALLEELAAHPPLARLLFVDSLFVGGEALILREHALARIRAKLPVPVGAPPQVAEAALGGVVETIYHTVLAGGASQLPGMVQELLYCLLVPLLGHERAYAVPDPGFPAIELDVPRSADAPRPR